MVVMVVVVMMMVVVVVDLIACGIPYSGGRDIDNIFQLGTIGQTILRFTNFTFESKRKEKLRNTKYETLEEGVVVVAGSSSLLAQFQKAFQSAFPLPGSSPTEIFSFTDHPYRYHACRYHTCRRFLGFH
ncbi:hypothetical protein M0804_007469 [Polistes exclamans]|nr:hypothetical protein M0804_007469 [Polistes exclamans]